MRKESKTFGIILFCIVTIAILMNNCAESEVRNYPTEGIINVDE